MPNHCRAVSRRKLTKRVDTTGDLTVKKYHNFAIADAGNGGIFVHNSTLMQQDIRFARTVKRIRKYFIYGVRQLLEMHYALMATKDNGDRFNTSKHNFLVQMSPISYLDEFERLQLIELRMQIISHVGYRRVAASGPHGVGHAYILSNYAKLPDNLIMRLMMKPDGRPDQAAQQPATQPGESVPITEQHSQAARRLGFAPLLFEEARKGYTGLNGAEKQAIAQAVAASPLLRLSVWAVRENNIDDLVESQTDASYLPPRCYEGKDVVEVCTDSVEEKKEVQELLEDYAQLGKKAG